MHKFKFKDQDKKDGQLRSWQLSLSWVKLHEIKSLEAITNIIKRIWSQLKIVNPKLKILKDASFNLNKENVSDTSFARLTFVLIILVDRVDNFKWMNAEL